MARILLIEDHPLCAELTTEILTYAGHHVLAARTGQDALQKATTERVDLVLVDLSLPDMDGLELIRQLKAGAPWQLVVVAVTAHAWAKDRYACLAAGCAGFISKPIDAETFPDVIAGYLL